MEDWAKGKGGASRLSTVCPFWRTTQALKDIHQLPHGRNSLSCLSGNLNFLIRDSFGCSWAEPPVAALILFSILLLSKLILEAEIVGFKTLNTKLRSLKLRKREDDSTVYEGTLRNRWYWSWIWEFYKLSCATMEIFIHRFCFLSIH